MTVYDYRGVFVASGKPAKGVRDAESLKALRAMLRRDGVLLTHAEEGKVNAPGQKREWLKMFRRISAQEVATMTRQLATLVGARIPLVEAMNALTEQSEQFELVRVLTQVREQLNEGNPLNKALAMHPKVFSPLYINMVAAGEESGNLESVLARLADYMESQSKLKSKVVASLTYPALMSVVGIGLVTMMMTVVVPKVTVIFETLDQELAIYTQLLIAISNFLSSPFLGGFALGALASFIASLLWGRTSVIAKAIAAAALLGALSVGMTTTSMLGYSIGFVFGIALAFGIARYRAYVQTPDGLEWRDRTMLRLPLFGPLLRTSAVARFTRTLGTLLGSGVPMLKALDIVKNVIGNARLATIVDEAYTSVREGQALSLPLKKSGEFPSMAVHMITVGEKSGELEAMLENVAAEFERQVETKIQTLTSLMEPLIIVMMGAGIGFITFAIMMPLIQMNNAF